MNQIVLQTLQIMLSMITSDKESITKQMKTDARKVIENLMTAVVKDSDDVFKQFSTILS